MMQVPGPRDPVDSATIRSAFLDATARAIVEGARARRDRVDRSITRYTARSVERISFGVSALRRDRLVYRRELAARIEWNREGDRVVEVEGAREVVPVAFRGVRLPEDLHEIGEQAFDPADDTFVFFSDDPDAFVVHPLSPGAERHYRYRTGDTTTIRLQDGRTLRLLSLETLPRVRSPHYVTGTMWMEAETYAPVRFIFRLAEPFDLIRDIDPEERDDIPAWLPTVRADMNYLTVEYGLWELRWWMPRVIALEGSAEMGFLRFPVRYERRYDEYTVEGDPGAPPLARDSLRALPTDSAAMEPCRLAREAGARGRCQCSGGDCRLVRVEVPTDTASLLRSERLPPTPWTESETVLTESELRGVGDALRANIPAAPWQVGTPTLSWGMRGAGAFRYNRIEALSAGGMASLDLGRVQTSLTGRIGIADLEPNGELTVSRSRGTRRTAVTGYRRLAAMNPEQRPLSFGNSFNALVFGRDDGEYYRTLGVELVGEPAVAATRRAWEWRVFHERQETAEVETDFSVPHLFDRGRTFRPNRATQQATQTGAATTLRWTHGFDPGRVSWSGEIEALGSTGTFDYTRGAVTLRAGLPLGGSDWRDEGEATTGGGVSVSVEVAAGTTGGHAPVQGLWYLGGPATMRGYAGAVAGGESFWRARLELGTARPAARIAVFGDAGWIGPRDEFRGDPNLASVGIGGSFMDGLLRLDLARALERPTGWRLDLYLDGLL